VVCVTPKPVLGTFPLSLVANGGRPYYQTASGVPFWFIGDSPWDLTGQCTRAQVDTYLADCAAKGFTSITIEFCDRVNSSQTPADANADSGARPFTGMSPVNLVMNDQFWQMVDYTVAKAKSLGIFVWGAPIYTGYGNGGDGWRADYTGLADAVVQGYGSAWATRYAAYGNAGLVMGGDDANDLGASGAYQSGTTPDRTKQWQFVVGARSVNPNILVCGHTARAGEIGAVNGEGYLAWNGYPGWTTNTVYPHIVPSDPYSLMATAFARQLPTLMIEAGYESTSDSTNVRTAFAQAMFSGAVGANYGHDVLWNFGSAASDGLGAAHAISTYLNSTGRNEIKNVAAFIGAYPWQKAVPSTGAAVITSSLSSSTTRICPMLATDGTFAATYCPSGTGAMTVSMAGITSGRTAGRVRTRWYSLSSGAYSTAGAGDYANSGTQSLTPPAGDQVLVMD
jgi:hypothetical protein